MLRSHQKKKPVYIRYQRTDDRRRQFDRGHCGIEDVGQGKKEALNDLSERDRNILYYKFFEGYAAKDIAKMLNIPKININVYIKRAHDRLIKILRKRGITNDF